MANLSYQEIVEKQRRRGCITPDFADYSIDTNKRAKKNKSLYFYERIKIRDICQRCGEEFQGKPSQNYCSNSCRLAEWRNKGTTRVKLNKEKK